MDSQARHEHLAPEGVLADLLKLEAQIQQEKLKAAHRASVSEFDALFASLQHRAFPGEF